MFEPGTAVHVSFTEYVLQVMTSASHDNKDGVSKSDRKIIDQIHHYVVITKLNSVA
jgi:hypothetical protein